MKRAIDLLALAAGHSGLTINGIDESKAMIRAVDTFSTLHDHHLTATQGWQFLAQYLQARLAQDPNNTELLNELLIALARASEESQHAAYVLANAPVPDGKNLDQFWNCTGSHCGTLDLRNVPLYFTASESPVPTAPVVVEPAPVVEPDPVAQEPEPVAELPEVAELTAEDVISPDWKSLADPEQRELSMDEKFKAYEEEQSRREEAAWQNTPKTKSFNGHSYIPQPCWLPDEKVAPGRVKEYKDHTNYKSGWWREGFPYKIAVAPQPGAPSDAPEYFIHCAERPSMEEFDKHAQLYVAHLCFTNVLVSDGSKSYSITREYTNKDANKTVAKTALQPVIDDSWTEDADWRVRYYDLRVNHDCYEYFDHRPSGILLAKYHRAKHYASVQNREEWLHSQKQLNAASSTS